MNVEMEEQFSNCTHSNEIYLNRKEELYKKRSFWNIKRAGDIILSLMALIVLAIPMMIIALIIWIDDPKGSPIFMQVRCGRDGKKFKFYKFRTMCMDAEEKLEDLLKHNEMVGPAFKMADDPRVTSFGKFLRKTGLDELPQLWNILRGDMSIVGPRPCVPREVEQYDEYERQRLYVTPGLTCFWQIQPDRNSLSFDEWMELDIKYIQERSVWVDTKIIFKTVGTVLKCEGK